ncbi:hypothetical protein WDU94_001907 [Cyamophila willieti]
MFLLILKTAVVFGLLVFYWLSEVRVEDKKINVKIDVGLLKEKCQISGYLFQNFWITGKSEAGEHASEPYSREKIEYFGSPADVGFYNDPFVTVERQMCKRKLLQNDEPFMSETLKRETLKPAGLLPRNIINNEPLQDRMMDTNSLMEDRVIDTNSLEESTIDTESLEDRLIDTIKGNIETESLDRKPHSTETPKASEDEDDQTIVPDENHAEMSKEDDLLDGVDDILHDPPWNRFEIEIAETTSRPSHKEEFLKMVSHIVRKAQEEVEKIKAKAVTPNTRALKEDGSHYDKHELTVIVVPSINRSGYFGYQPELKQLNQLANTIVNASTRPYVRTVTNIPYFKYLRKLSSVTYVMN